MAHVEKEKPSTDWQAIREFIWSAFMVGYEGAPDLPNGVLCFEEAEDGDEWIVTMMDRRKVRLRLMFAEE